MLKRFVALLLGVLMLFGAAVPAMADAGTLDRVLGRWLEGYPDVRFTAGLQLNAMLPYGEDTLAMLNAALSHVTVSAALRTEGDQTETRASIAMGDQALLSFSETQKSDAYRFTTSLLPNRTLTSQTLSPLDLLTDIQPEQETTAAAEGEAAAKEAGKADAKSMPNQSDIAVAFSALDAVTELTACYKALTDGIAPITEEKRANYNIKGIGAGRWSRVARLTEEQSVALQDTIRTVIACGMDEIYRAEIAQMTFDKGFVVALYQNLDKQDICLYMKGTVTYPDGHKRRLLWQWAFTTNGLKRKDAFKIEAATLSGAADSRTVAATVTQEGKSDAFAISGKVETILKRAKVTDKSTVRIELSGKQDAVLAMTCKGAVSQEIATTTGEDTVKATESADIDLLLTPGAEGATLSGTVTRKQLRDKTATSELVLTFTPEAQAVANVDATAPAAETTETPAGGEPASSLDMLADEFAPTDAPQAADAQGDYLVGTPPAGLKAYAAPQGMTTIALDTITAGQRQTLFLEAAQNLAGRLVLAMAALPEADAALLRNGMSDQDFAAFLSLLGAR